ncbi:MAG: 50S ribosomal protein L22 [Omnitrophica bacterium RIFCSPLOWO2_12_FULL_44_17]|uniref:Large ribosomal subunit protein uL22 n=1 Tax=Candidatus Danuiimicrobium aquiferis TaxID=1801832 RepID=A0A1G1KZZ4_9BACT|nr:MAG: 50S ribosomal protein L22 [Omnitrophica bacterium RIFCSPHIGHO2_02_FULL_45_28]OGW91766.1 MAG: 50S ribosomal protein L22 [Omnitrophica bacterium RIFCSPHIGHO2_12_FULL_44_12]OGW98470.1 MAG: 50S ribosomal protein L22 [Omnitrophica bacterium RIFCSPLOWO2_12_FULL_44_17]OGX02917.1 MAG: 50S ribosomal protein L22 [Omnitrophica bacterium RIFCSPLOWO2_02_FULL_44_11]
MEAKAVTKHIRISPRKLRLVVDTIRYKSVPAAYGVLQNLNKKGSPIVEKTLKSAHANAKVKKMDETRLYVAKIFADGGPVMKRYMERSMGRADVVLKRTAHLTVVLKEKDMAKRPKVEIAEKTGESKLPLLSKVKKSKKAAGVA